MKTSKIETAFNSLSSLTGFFTRYVDLSAAQLFDSFISIPVRSSLSDKFVLINMSTVRSLKVACKAREVQFDFVNNCINLYFS
jgi:hypothetical protein